MRHTDEHILVITDGSLSSLLACLIAESEVGGADGAAGGSQHLAVSAWLAPAGAGLFPRETSPEIARRFVEHQVEALSLAALIEPQLNQPGMLAPTQTLIAAMSDAMMSGCRRVIWPCALGDDLDAVHVASERALAIAQLVALDAHVAQDSPALETPFLDCTPEMLLRLADDLDAPLTSCWLSPEELAALEAAPGAGPEAMRSAFASAVEAG